MYYGYKAPKMLDQSALEFTIEQYNWYCKLAFEGTQRQGKYLLWINGKLVTDLQKAPPVRKENLPVVC